MRESKEASGGLKTRGCGELAGARGIHESSMIKVSIESNQLLIPLVVLPGEKLNRKFDTELQTRL